MSKHDKNHANHQENNKADDASDKASNVGVLNKDPKANLNETGVSAKKAEECLAAACETGLTDLGQSGSVPVGQREVTAPHLEADQLKEKGECSKEAQNKGGAQKDAGEKCEAKPEGKAQPEAKAQPKENQKEENKKEECKNDKHKADAKNGKDAKAAECNSDNKKDAKSNKDGEGKAEKEHQSVATIGLEVAAGLAMMAVDSAGKVFKDAGKNWEDKVDAAANKAHETIETAQRAIRDPLGETLKQVDHLAHPDKSEKKK
jgi:hypothetical protein